MLKIRRFEASSSTDSAFRRFHQQQSVAQSVGAKPNDLRHDRRISASTGFGHPTRSENNERLRIHEIVLGGARGIFDEVFLTTTKSGAESFSVVGWRWLRKVILYPKPVAYFIA